MLFRFLDQKLLVSKSEGGIKIDNQEDCQKRQDEETQQAKSIHIAMGGKSDSNLKSLMETDPPALLSLKGWP